MREDDQVDSLTWAMQSLRWGAYKKPDHWFKRLLRRIADTWGVLTGKYRAIRPMVLGFDKASRGKDFDSFHVFKD
jgi:hypothetical protein